MLHQLLPLPLGMGTKVGTVPTGRVLPDANFFAKKLAMKGREKVKFLETYLKLQETNANYIVLMRSVKI